MAGGQAWSWDSNGNLTAKVGEADFAWDFEDRLQQATLADGTLVTHTYDANGVRVRTVTTSPGGPTEVVDYLVDTSEPLSHVVAETDGSGSLVAYYVRGVELLGVLRPAETRYYHADGQDSVRVLTDETGVVTDRYTYEAFASRRWIPSRASAPSP